MMDRDQWEQGPVADSHEHVNDSYVYWTLDHLDSWIKMDHLDVTCFIISLFTAQHVLNVSTSIFRCLRLIVDLFHVLYCSGSMCVGVTNIYRNTLIKTTTHVTINQSPLNKDANAKTSILTEQYNTWNKSTIIRKLLKMDVLTLETCWAVNSEIIKQVISSWSIFIHLT